MKSIVLRVHHAQVSIPKGAEDQAHAFYCDVLGLKEVPKPASLAGRGGFWPELGDIQIHFGAKDRVDRKATISHVAYQVENLEAWRVRLTQNGVEILDGIPIPNYERFEFRDPFGNRVEFLERQTGLSL